MKIHPARILPALLKIQPLGDPVFSARYVGAVGHEKRTLDEQSSLQFLGMKMGQVDQTYRQIDSEGVTVAELHRLAKQATHHEELCLLIALLDELDQKKSIPIRALARFVEVVDNWAISDQLSSILARAFERDPKAAMPIYRKWNQSRDPWARRQSLVGLYYYATQRKRFPPETFVLSQLEPLLQDPHFYVQKGVGWTLRELYRANPELQLKFVRSHLREISGTAWFATSECYPAKLKTGLVKERRSSPGTATGAATKSKTSRASRRASRSARTRLVSI